MIKKTAGGLQNGSVSGMGDGMECGTMDNNFFAFYNRVARRNIWVLEESTSEKG